MTGKRLLVKVGGDCQKWRQEHGIKVEELAKVIGYSPYTIYAFEQGRLDSLKIFLLYLMFGYTIGGDDISQLFKNYCN